MTDERKSGIEGNGTKPAEQGKKAGRMVVVPHKYTQQEHEFLKTYVSGHSHKEITEAFNKRFGSRITINQIKSYIHNHGLNTGRTGRFEKGSIPHNKGMKGICYPGSERGHFQKGNIPHNHRPVGSERVNVDGYVEIKVAEPNKWKLKHRAIWEAAYGDIPKFHVVIFKDNDPLNVTLENLMLIRRRELLVLNRTGLNEHTEEYKDTAVAIAKLQIACSNRRRETKRNEHKSIH